MTRKKRIENAKRFSRSIQVEEWYEDKLVVPLYITLYLSVTTFMCIIRTTV